MEYSKPMVDLVREIRKRVPSDDKPSIKLANPELLDELARIYQASSDNVLKALTRELMNMAGDPWVKRLETDIKPAESSATVGFATKVYRGQTRLEEKNVETAPALTADTPEKPKRMYRGQVVA